jgi:hypothetical protein
MSQIRIWNYGDTFTASKVKQAQRVLNIPGVYEGYTITVSDTNKVTLAANGYLLLPDGVLVTENVDIVLTLSTLPAAAKTYTITCRHSDSDIIGGVAAVYTIEEDPITLADGVAIGYINYPGGAVPLLQSYVVQAPRFEEYLNIRLYSSNSMPDLPETGMAAFWKDTDNSNKIYLIFKRGVGDTVKVQLT